jgi:NADP-dependent 3-hydroxy acid dehydrogenase YdfG
VLINNAGLALGLEAAHEAHLDDWDNMIDTNCRGLVTMTRAVLPRMVARGSGIVINIGSVAGAYPYPGGNVYGATKAFVDQFTLNLRADLVGTGALLISLRGWLVELNFLMCASKVMTKPLLRSIKVPCRSTPVMSPKPLTGSALYRHM